MARLRSIAKWFSDGLWTQQELDAKERSQRAQDCHHIFTSGPQGLRYLQYLIDNIYCTTYEGTDPIACMAHNARRSVIHEILQTIDAVRHPDKYEPPKVETHTPSYEEFIKSVRNGG